MPEERRRHDDSQAEAAHEQHQRQPQSLLDGDRARRKRSKSFSRVVAIGSQIQQVIRNIGAGCAEAERDKRQQRDRKELDVGDSMRGDQWHEQQQVLEPLVRTHRAEPRRAAAATGRKYPGYARAPGGPGLDSALGPDQQRAPRFGPDPQVGMRISRVIELPAPESTPQSVEFPLRGQIRLRIAGQDFVEQPDVLGYLARILLVGGGRQDDVPTASTLLAQVRDDLFVIWQDRSIQIDLIRDVLLELSAAAAQSVQGANRTKRAGLDQPEEGFQQDVGPDQGSIEVYAQGYRIGPAVHVVHRLSRLNMRSGTDRINSMIGRQNHGR